MTCRNPSGDALSNSLKLFEGHQYITLFSSSLHRVGSALGLCTQHCVSREPEKITARATNDKTHHTWGYIRQGWDYNLWSVFSARNQYSTNQLSTRMSVRLS